jgi:hypothetical protein
MADTEKTVTHAVFDPETCEIIIREESATDAGSS